VHVNTCPIFQFLLRSPANASQTSKSCLLHYDTFAFLRNASLSILGHTVRLRRRPLVFIQVGAFRCLKMTIRHTQRSVFQNSINEKVRTTAGRTDERRCGLFQIVPSCPAACCLPPAPAALLRTGFRSTPADQAQMLSEAACWHTDWHAAR
jgi:hypothetical protein